MQVLLYLKTHEHLVSKVFGNNELLTLLTLIRIQGSGEERGGEGW